MRAAAWHVWRNYPPAKDWGRDLLWRWIGWHASNNTVAVVTNDNGHVVGVGIARLVMNGHDGRDPYEYDPEGKCLFVDLSTATQPGAFLTLFLMALKRFGHRPEIAYRRYPSTAIKVRPLRKLRDKMIRNKALYG